MPTAKVTMYVDGSCSGNPGTGGYAAILLAGTRRKDVTGGATSSTNNTMELTAVLEGVKAILKPCHVEVVTDSENVIGWLSRGWKRRKRHISLLCQEIEATAQEKHLNLTFSKVDGHAGNEFNELADALAKTETWARQ